LLEQVGIMKIAATQTYPIERSTHPQESSDSSKDFDQSIVEKAIIAALDSPDKTWSTLQTVCAFG
jgi:hypothetical protein